MNTTTQAATSTPEMEMPNKSLLSGVDMPVFLISGGVLALFAAFALYDIDMVSGWVNAAFGMSTKIVRCLLAGAVAADLHYWSVPDGWSYRRSGYGRYQNA